jgi:NAD-dependent dihydropyrimidine dehydrogenase PreA subunit
LALLLVAFNACAKEIDLRPGMAFLKARAMLQAGGWRPVDMHANDGYEFIGVEKKLKARHVNEIESCAIDRGLCIFNYKKSARCIRLIARGEDVGGMRIDSWSHACPEAATVP